MMDDVMTEIYPPELSLTNDAATVQANYLDLSIEIKNDKNHTSLFDKRDTFGFAVVNFPDLSGNIPQKQSYGVFVSQLIRYARCCQDLEDFRERTRKLVDRLVHTSLFDESDTFGFAIINFADLSGNIPQKQSNAVFVSQPIRYARCCL